MSDKLFANPTNAFGYTNADGNTQYQEVAEFAASAAVGRGQIVRLDAVAGVVTVSPATAATDFVVGVAIDSAAPGQTVRVCTKGVTLVRASTTNIADRTAFSPGAAGRVAAATTTSGEFRVGVTLEATGTVADALKLCWVDPNRHTVGI